MDHRNIIANNIQGLVDHIDPKNTTLWENLIMLELFKCSDVEYIKVSIHLKS